MLITQLASEQEWNQSNLASLSAEPAHLNLFVQGKISFLTLKGDRG